MPFFLLNFKVPSEKRWLAELVVSPGIASRVTYRAAHVGERLLRTFHTASLCTHGERSRYVAAELHRDATTLKESTSFTTGLFQRKP